MSEFEYLLLGGSRHGTCHTENGYKPTLEFPCQQVKGKIPCSKTERENHERYDVYSEESLDGKRYLIACCGVTDFPAQKQLYQLIIEAGVTPLPETL
ncbi:hypothetical protein [Edaphovirga cremea]|uniref:hypothetical protein n=1 Tax=Edaphovirga cremea TaxID=2267246 RepID=UPI000DEFDEEB|nr:hypothetical protein [Edaphovirga cremea]